MSGALSGVTGIVGSIVGTGMQTSALNKGIDKGLGALQNEQDQAFQFLQPYNDLGQLAYQYTTNANGLNGSAGSQQALTDFQASPGYDYSVQQGLRAVDAGAASKGMLRSGATLKAEQTLGNNLANQQWQQYLGNLNSLVGVGQTAANKSADIAQSTGKNMASLYADQGSALASIYGKEAENVTKGASSIFSAFGL